MKHKRPERPYKATKVHPGTGRLLILWDKARQHNPIGVVRLADFVLGNGYAADPELLIAYSYLADPSLARQ